MLPQVLTGTGGVGKTQLAAHYARSAWDDGNLDVLVWVTASAQSAVVSGYAQAGVELCRASPDDPEQAAKQFLAWLAPKPGQRPCRWLVVLDDVAEPNDLIVHPEASGTGYSLWPPASAHGRVLLTTRRRDAALFGEGRRRIEVGLFTPDESVAYLTSSLNARGRAEPSDQLTALAHDLGHLPLALAQAAAYIVDSGEGAAAYRELLSDRATTLGHLTPDALPDEQATALAAVWSLSVDRANTLRPGGLARPMLDLVSLLDASGIPQDVLTSQPVLTHLGKHRTRASTARTRRSRWWPGRWRSPVAFEEAVGALRALDRLSLIDHQPGTPHQAVRVHQLIQRATRDNHTLRQHLQTARTAADALLATWPDIERDTDLAQVLRTNTGALARQAEDALYRREAHAVLHRFGSSIGASGQVTTAVNQFQYLADTSRRRLGEDHIDTFIMRSNLASSWGQAGDPGAAVQALVDLLPDEIRVLGKNHRETLMTRSNLAHWRGQAGDVAGAVQAFADLLPDRIRALGKNHPDTLGTRNSLASWRGEVGDAAGAAQAFADLLTDRIRVLGEDHPDTLVTRNNLASYTGKAGDTAGALQAFTDLLTYHIRVLGEDHPDTLAVRNNLASWRGEVGDAAGAAQAFADLLTDQIRVLGEDHPDTLITRNNLAVWQGKLGGVAEAAHALAQLVADRIRVLGEDHPDTLIARSNLAFCRGEVGDAAGAAQAFADLLTDRIRVLGEDHPDTLIAQDNLALWRGKAGDAPGAAQAYEHLLQARRRLIGEDHPSTLAAWGSSAHWRGQAGDVVGAVTYSKELLEHMVRVLGEDHPHLRIVRSNLDHWQKEAQRAQDAG
ncbi:tetratricopeptide repeat protein [Streptomyces gardneri]|uniref:tetratricopeptide repeat protein n=1 Tax=Streptomyces gardneri TaxID=66892 RepID=UPI0035E1AD42